MPDFPVMSHLQILADSKHSFSYSNYILIMEPTKHIKLKEFSPY